MNDGVVAVGMSGGIDSAVAAALLKEQRYDLIAVTAVMSGEYSRCCSTEDIRRAEAVAAALGIRHYVVDVVDEFQTNVINYFVSDYLSGMTPSPCVLCNQTIKFGALLSKAIDLGASQVATGHYARIDRAGRTYRLKRGVDMAKDQSYFLARLNQEQLSRTLFPLGEMRKKEVSRYAAEHELMARRSRESQELCFIETGTHGEWMDLRILEAAGPGDILDTAGKKLGFHKGIHHYTIGQRKGLGVAAGRPVYVTEIDAERNVVVVGDRSDAMRREMKIRDTVWISGQVRDSGVRACCQVRYNHNAAPCRVSPAGDNLHAIFFDEPQFAVTPGQLAVLYDGDEVIGAGWIVLAVQP